MMTREDITQVGMSINDREGIGTAKLRPIWDRSPIRDGEPTTEITRRIPPMCQRHVGERAYYTIKACKELLRHAADAIDPKTDRVALKLTFDTELGVRLVYAIRPAAPSGASA